MKKKKKRKRSRSRLKNYYVQIHFTVVNEVEFLERLKSKRALEHYRDEILDGINSERRELGYLL